MKEFIYSRNAVYETLRAKRRDVFKLQVSEGAQEKGRLADILKMAKDRRIPIEKVQRGRLDRIHQNHQGIVTEVSGYTYSDVVEILELASQRNEPPFILLLDSLNDPQNFGTLLRTAESVGVHGVIIPLAHTVAVTPAVVNASSGASEHLEEVPRLNRPAEVWEHISLVRVLIEPLDGVDTVEIAYRTDWDTEHTVGARFQRWALVELNGSVL